MREVEAIDGTGTLTSLARYVVRYRIRHAHAPSSLLSTILALVYADYRTGNYLQEKLDALHRSHTHLKNIRGHLYIRHFRTNKTNCKNYFIEK